MQSLTSVPDRTVSTHTVLPERSGSERRKIKYASLEARVMTSGPLYTVALVFVLVNAILFWHGVLLEAKVHTNFKRYTTVIARGCGYMLNFNIPVLLLVASRNIMTLARRTPLNLLIPFDHVMPNAHIFLGYVCFISAALHGTFHLVPGIIAGSWKPGFLKWTYAISTGLFLFSVFSTMVFFARKTIRERKFELFYYVHMIGAVVVIGTLFVHGILFEKLYTFKWIAPAVILYVLDRVFRKLRERHGYITVAASGSLSFAQGGVFKLSIPKCMDYKAGQWAEICVPSISALQWHPFTIASAPSESHMVFFIKQSGDWTNKLGLLLTEKKELTVLEPFDKTGTRIECYLRGPYGAPAQHVGQFDKVVLISGGVGGTPFVSVVKEAIIHITKRANSANSERCIQLSQENQEEGTGVVLRPRSIESHNIEGKKIPRTETSSLDLVGLETICSDDERRRITSEYRTSHSSKASLEPSSRTAVDQSSTDGELEYEAAFVSTIQKIYFGLSSTTMAFAILWLTIFRFFLVLLAVIIEEGLPIHKYTRLKVLPEGFQIADLVLSSVVAALSVTLILLDLYYKGRKTPLLLGLLDITISIPVLLSPVVFHILHFIDVIADHKAMVAFAYYYAIWPLTLCVVIFRHVRNGTGTTVLATNIRNTYGNTRSLDYIYTTPNSRSDDWLVAELGPYAQSPYFRLHRFLTRELPDEEGFIESDGRWSNHYGRPNWNHIVENLVRNVKSGSSIGIFFCGPRAMEIEVREACYRAMVQSRRRGMYYQQCMDSVQNIVRTDTQGCNVRLMVRAENI